MDKAGSTAAFEALPIALKKKITSVQLGRKVSSQFMREIIVDICKHTPVSVATMSQWLNRDKGYLAQEYISSMVQVGLIIQTISETPNHPDQKYTVKKQGRS